MLLHQTLDLEESGKQVPFVPRSVDGVGERFVIVEWLQERIEGISVLVLDIIVVVVLRGGGLGRLG